MKEDQWKPGVSAHDITAAHKRNFILMAPQKGLVKLPVPDSLVGDIREELIRWLIYSWKKLKSLKIDRLTLFERFARRLPHFFRKEGQMFPAVLCTQIWSLPLFNRYFGVSSPSWERAVKLLSSWFSRVKIDLKSLHRLMGRSEFKILYFNLPAVDQIQNLYETSAFLIAGFECRVFSLLVSRNCQLCLNSVYIFTVVC